jgi:hypothetical protein
MTINRRYALLWSLVASARLNSQHLFRRLMVPPLRDYGDNRAEVKVLLFLNARQEDRIPTEFSCLRVFDPMGQVAVRHGRPFLNHCFI